MHLRGDSIQFLGFAIQKIPSKTLKDSANKKVETFKRRQNRIFEKSVQEYRRFLKIMEWFGRKAIAAAIYEKTAQQRRVFEKKTLKEIIVSKVPRKNWFYYGHRLNTKRGLVFKFCYENQEHKLKRWVNVKQNLLFSRESVE